MKGILKVLLSYIILLVLIAIVAAFTGCKTKTLIEYVPVEKVVKVQETIRDTVINFVPVPDEKQNAVQPSDTSKLDNKYAESWAFWDGSLLHHSLKTKQDSIPVKVQTKDKVTTITLPVIVPVKGDTIVTNELTWYQKLCVYWTLFSLLVLIVFVVYRIKR